MSLLAVEGPAREIERSVDLACHDEIVLVQSFDFLGAQRDGHVTPAEADLGVMAGVLGEFTDFLNKGECFPEIAKSKGPHDVVGIVIQLPIGRLCLECWASSRVSGGTPPRQGVQVFSASVSLMYFSPRQFLSRKATAGERSSIDLSEHDIERADDRRDISKHVPAAQEVHRLKMDE